MQTSSRYQIAYPSLDRSDSADVPRDINQCVLAIEKSVMYSQGATASRPVSTPATPGIQGRIYFDTTVNLMYYDYGTGWMVVGSTDIADRSVAGIKLELGAVTNSEIQDRTITGVKLVMGTVTRDEMADLTITDAKVANRAITGTKLVAGTITSTEIGAHAILRSNLAASSVGTSEIMDGAITAAKINNTLKPSAGAAATTEALRAIGTGAGQAMPGSPSRINIVNPNAAGSDYFITGLLTGESNYRILVRNDGLIYWGPGPTGSDVWMRRLDLGNAYDGAWQGVALSVKTTSGGICIDHASESDRSVLRIGSIDWNPTPGDRCIALDRGNNSVKRPNDGGIIWIDASGQLCYMGTTGTKKVIMTQ